MTRPKVESTEGTSLSTKVLSELEIQIEVSCAIKNEAAG